MAREIVWIHAGPLAGQFREMSSEEAARAVADEWGQVANNSLTAAAMKKPDKKIANAAAAAYATALDRGREPQPQPPGPPPGPPPPNPPPDDDDEAAAAATYPTRELRAEDPKRPRGRPRKLV